MIRRVDIAVVGGGPAGLAAAIEAASRGLQTVVLERRDAAPDKACGEGLMPAGVQALARLGALEHLAADGCAPFVGIRYLQEDGTHAAARFAAGCGLGVRRPALVDALLRRAIVAGAELRWGARVEHIAAAADGVRLRTGAGELHARLVIAADGLSSPIRQAIGLDGRPARSARFGVRRHFAVQPWSDHVEVHWSDGVEAYVTPVGPCLVGVAFLWDQSRLGPQRFDRLLARFPLLALHLENAAPASEDRGAGPLLRRVTGRVRARVALIGDAAGYVDALSGEGLSLAFAQAAALGPLLPDAVRRGDAALAPYERAAAASFRRYAALTRALLLLSRWPPLRRRAIGLFAARPRLFAAALATFAPGDGSVQLALPQPTPAAEDVASRAARR